MKPKSVTAYCATYTGDPTTSCLNYRRKSTLARVIEVWGKNWKNQKVGNQKLKIIKVKITKA
jgi:hypothetical protein